MTNELPVPTSSPGAGSVVPSAPNSRLRTYSNSAGSLDAIAMSSEVLAETVGAAVRGSGPLGSSSGSTPSAPIAGAGAFYGPAPPAPRPPSVADLGEPRPHVVDPEVLWLEPACLDLVPRERCGHRRPWLRPQGKGGRDIGALPVHVVVDEDLAGAVRDPPRHRHAVGVGAPDHPPTRSDERANLAVRPPAGLDLHVDLQSCGAARLW